MKAVTIRRSPPQHLALYIALAMLAVTVAAVYIDWATNPGEPGPTPAAMEAAERK